jgi:CheY-like chemotaxis protein
MPDDKEVLIVDDSEENVAFMQEILEEMGLPNRVARNGKEGMQALEEKRPDLVLLDIMMPRKSGVKVFQEMKRDPELEKIPIIIVTGLGEATGVDIETGREDDKESSCRSHPGRIGREADRSPAAHRQDQRTPVLVLGSPAAGAGASDPEPSRWRAQAGASSGGSWRGCCRCWRLSSPP